MAQVAMQRQGIKLILQVVAMRLHGRGHRLLRIGGAVFTQPVRFVIEQVIAPLMAEYQVNKAF